MKNRFLQLIAALLLLINFNYLQAQTLPAGIAGLNFWLDASDVNNGTANPADGTSVTTWYDKSGLHHNASVFPGQSSGKLYANQINGKPVVRFTRAAAANGSVYEVMGVDINAATINTITLFTVYRQGSQSGDQGLWGIDNGVWDRMFFTSFPSYVGVNNGFVSPGSFQQLPPPVANAGLAGFTRLITVVYNHLVTNGSSVYFNGPNLYNFTDRTDTGRGSSQTDLRIGWDGDGNCYNGDIAEMIIYNRELTACEIQQVNHYLGNKYGMVFSTVSINAGGSTILGQGGSVTLTSSVTGIAYQWLVNGAPIIGATVGSFTATAAGSYTVAVTNTCTDTSAATIVTTTLPVTLINFTASQVTGFVQLRWSTASELNSADFQIERSSNGTDFARIGTIQATGTSSSLLKYVTNDETPHNGVNYYRLKQVDKDGNFTYSAVQQIVFVAGKAYTILYPSPATDHFIIESNDAALTGSTGFISDIQGKMVKQFVVTGSRHEVNISGLIKGVYNVQLANKSTFRIVKE